MTRHESTIIGLGCAALGVLGMIFLDRAVGGIIHTVLASAVIVVLLTAALVLHHAGPGIIRVTRRNRGIKCDRANEQRSIP